MLNMNELAVADTGFLHLKGPNDEKLFGDKKPAGITFYSPGTAIFAEAIAERDDRLVEWVRENGEKDMPFEQKRESNAIFLAKVTKSFDNWSYTPGDDAKNATGFDLFKAAYLDRSIGFVAVQGERFLGKWGNFTKGSAKS